MKPSILILLLLLLLQEVAVSRGPVYFYLPPKTKTKGFAVTTGNDTLKGYFYLNYKGAIFNKDENAKRTYKTDTVLLSSNLISIFLELKSESLLNPGDLIEYDYLPKYKHMYRKLYSGKHDYYDDNIHSYNLKRINNYIIIVNNANKETSIIGSDFKGAKKSLVDYLNNSRNTGFRYEEFQNPIQVIQEIEKRQ